MLENGISTRTMPHESKFQNLATFMKRYGTVKLEAEKIGGYIDQLDSAMKQFTVRLVAFDLSIRFSELSKDVYYSVYGLQTSFDRSKTRSN